MTIDEVQSPLVRSGEGGTRFFSSDLVPNRKVQPVAQRSFLGIACNFAEGLWRSKIWRAVVLTAAAVTLLFFLVSNPVGWVASALGVSLIVGKILFSVGTVVAFGLFCLLQAPLQGTYEFEFSALRRLSREKNFDEIDIPGWANKPKHSLYISALPNQLRFSEGEKILRSGGTVISINEPWEREPYGVSIPYKAKDWDDLGINYREINVYDHELLPPEAMDKVADEIKEGLNKGNTLAQCRAGVGRSGMAIAAYLMKYARKANEEPLSIEEICKGIKKSRKKATIWNKLHGLVAYDNYLQTNNFDRPVRTDKLDKAAQELLALKEQEKKVKLSPAAISELSTNP